MTPSDRAGSARRSPLPLASRPSTNPPRPTLSLVPRSPASKPHDSPLALWHLLSLDAPTVAALWTFAIAHVLGLHLPWTEPAAMFLAVWMLYAADRILDARILDAHILDARIIDARILDTHQLNAQPPHTHHAPFELEARHRFHHRHRRAFFFTIVFAAIALAALLHTLDPRALHLYALLATLLCVWLLLIHARPIPAADTRRLPKELAVGIFFPAAVFIPSVARLPHLRLHLLPVAALFAAVCTLNCLFLYAWEHPGARPHAHWTTRWLTSHLVALSLLIALASIAILILSSHSKSPLPHILAASSILTACTLLSALLLLLLHNLRRRLKPVHLRALADLVLLTPALILPLAALISR